MRSLSMLHLLHLCDSALPIGSFSHSAGLETYVQQGLITDKVKAKEFVTAQLSQNIFFTDAALVSFAYDAAGNNDYSEIGRLDELCTAVKLPEETRLASNKLGTRLLKVFQYDASHVLINDYKQGINEHRIAGHYCIAFGMIAHALEIDKQEALTGFYYNAASGFITNAVKLIPLGQQEGQEILVSLFPMIASLVEQSISPDKEMIGFCCAGFDIRSMQHQELYSRLYMS